MKDFGLVRTRSGSGIGTPGLITSRLPQIVGRRTFVVAATLDATHVLGIGRISNNLRFENQPECFGAAD